GQAQAAGAVVAHFEPDRRAVRQVEGDGSAAAAQLEAEVTAFADEDAATSRAEFGLHVDRSSGSYGQLDRAAAPVDLGAVSGAVARQGGTDASGTAVDLQTGQGGAVEFEVERTRTAVDRQREGHAGRQGDVPTSRTREGQPAS